MSLEGFGSLGYCLLSWHVFLCCYDAKKAFNVDLFFGMCSFPFWFMLWMEEVQQVYLPYDSADSLLLWLSLQTLFVFSDMTNRRDLLSLGVRIIWIAFVYSKYGKSVRVCVRQRRSQHYKVEANVLPFVTSDLRYLMLAAAYPKKYQTGDPHAGLMHI